MQTFLPYPSPVRSAGVLDMARLGKQRVETKQLLNSLLGFTNGRGWANHPAREMWRGYERALTYYGMVVSENWIVRGYKDTTWEWFYKLYRELARVQPKKSIPPWIGIEPFHAAHRSNLLRKDPVWYGQFGWSETPDLPYLWPTEQGWM